MLQLRKPVPGHSMEVCRKFVVVVLLHRVWQGCRFGGLDICFVQDICSNDF